MAMQLGSQNPNWSAFSGLENVIAAKLIETAKMAAKSEDAVR